MKPIGNSCSYSRCSPASRQISVNVGKTRPLSCNMDSEDSDMNECPEKRMRHRGPDQTSKETSHHLVKVCLSGSDSSSSDDDETQRFVVLPKNAIWPMPSILPKKGSRGNIEEKPGSRDSGDGHCSVHSREGFNQCHESAKFFCSGLGI